MHNGNVVYRDTSFGPWVDKEAAVGREGRSGWLAMAPTDQTGFPLLVLLLQQDYYVPSIMRHANRVPCTTTAVPGTGRFYRRAEALEETTAPDGSSADGVYLQWAWLSGSQMPSRHILHW